MDKPGAGEMPRAFLIIISDWTRPNQNPADLW